MRWGTVASLSAAMACTACGSSDALDGSGDAASPELEAPDATSDATILQDKDASTDGNPALADAPALGDAGACGPGMIRMSAGDAAAYPDGSAFCIDEYEAPNEAGAYPLYFQSGVDSDAWCKAIGKRLCTEAEWDRACKGADGDHTYPYGDGGAYLAHVCNDDKTWISPDWTTLGTYPSDASFAEAKRLYQGNESGSRAGCVTDEGVHDLTGNVAEWVVRSFPNSTNYDDLMKGCYWSGCYGGSHPNCGFINPAHPGAFRSYESGFRCCKDL